MIIKNWDFQLCFYVLWPFFWYEWVKINDQYLNIRVSQQGACWLILISKWRFWPISSRKMATLDIFFCNYLNFFSLKILLLEHAASLDLSNLRRGSGDFFFKNCIFEIRNFQLKDEVCHRFLVNIFTKSLLTGGVSPVKLFLKFEYAVHILVTKICNTWE